MGTIRIAKGHEETAQARRDDDRVGFLQRLRAAVVCIQNGDKEGAERILERLVAEDADNAEALGLYGDLLLGSGRSADALPLLQRAAHLAPRVAAYWWNLGTANQNICQPAAALEAWQRAIALEPEHWQLYFNIASLLECQSEFPRAEGFYRLALQKNDNAGPVWAGLGRVCAHLRRLREAEACFNQSLKLAPTAEAYSDLAQTLTAGGRPQEALAAARAGIALNPQLALARCQEGKALRDLDRPLECKAAFEAAIAVQPDCADAMEGLAQVLTRLCETEAAVSWFVRAMEAQPNRSFTHSSLLFTLSAAAAASPERLLEAHRGWAQMHASGIIPMQHSPAGEDPDRRLRLGFVSGDLRDHAVRFFISPVLRNLERSQFEVVCYSNCASADAATGQIRELANEWHDVASTGDDELASRIRDDRIDILVDLSGHTRDNRLLVFARRPAPIQATYLGYLNTTGLSAMDYWITDWIVHPVDTKERTTERIWRLPRCWVCYEPPEGSPAIAQCDGKRPITFGSFNASRKLQADTLRLWGRVLAALPGSRMLIKSDGLQLPADKLHMRGRLANGGIDQDRVTLVGRLPSREQHLALFGEVDVALDTLHWSGATTTAETLWMGVPVVTLSGDLMPSRMSASMLHAVGLEDLVARDEADFVQIAARLAGDAARRSQLRLELRDRMAASPLCNGRDLGHEMGNAFREMWRSWCAGSVGGVQ